MLRKRKGNPGRGLRSGSPKGLNAEGLRWDIYSETDPVVMN
jgi:hypothetical protein